jgi:hypothetical protein
MDITDLPLHARNAVPDIRLNINRMEKIKQTEVYLIESHAAFHVTYFPLPQCTVSNSISDKK